MKYSSFLFFSISRLLFELKWNTSDVVGLSIITDIRICDILAFAQLIHSDIHMQYMHSTPQFSQKIYVFIWKRVRSITARVCVDYAARVTKHFLEIRIVLCRSAFSSHVIIRLLFLFNDLLISICFYYSNQFLRII